MEKKRKNRVPIYETQCNVREKTGPPVLCIIDPQPWPGHASCPRWSVSRNQEAGHILRNNGKIVARGEFFVGARGRGKILENTVARNARFVLSRRVTRFALRDESVEYLIIDETFFRRQRDIEYINRLSVESFGAYDFVGVSVIVVINVSSFG